MPARRSLRWERRPDHRPQELLDAALAVFAEKGYRNTRLEEVADAAGVTKGTIYHYFSTKEELLLRAIEHYQDRAFGRLDDLLRSKKSTAAERIELFIRQGFGSDDPARRRMHALLLQGIGGESPDARRQWLKSGPLKGWRLLAKLIEEGKATGEFSPDVDADVIARITVSGLMLQLVWQQQSDSTPGLKISEKRLIESTLAGLLAALR